MQLDWSVLAFDPGSLILGDVGVLAGSATGELMNVLRHEPSLSSVYLPLSAERLLVGFRPGTSLVSLEKLNAASAELSRDFFISKEKELHSDLHPRIGAQQTLLSNGEMKNIVEGAFESLRS